MDVNWAIHKMIKSIVVVYNWDWNRISRGGLKTVYQMYKMDHRWVPTAPISLHIYKMKGWIEFYEIIIETVMPKGLG